MIAGSNGAEAGEIGNVADTAATLCGERLDS
jgi:hypothetical protein